MKLFLIEALVLFAIVLVVSAVFFRSRRAIETLRFLRNVGWAYVAAVIVLAAWQFMREGW